MYQSYPTKVTDYSVMMSVNGNSFTETGKVTSEENNFTLTSFITNAEYSFFIRANLEDGTFSTSNATKVTTTMQRPPQWINADYATINAENKVNLSFTIDPSSEITKFRLEKRVDTSDIFKEITQLRSLNGAVLFSDNEADVTAINYYRLLALNNCDSTVIASNISSNLVLSLEKTDNDLNFSWNSYKDWNGTISAYRFFINTGNGFQEKTLIQPTDTVFTISYDDIMYEITGNEICFYISASETSNPYGIAGQSLSRRLCIAPTKKITVPNVFTPNSGTSNAFFRPVLSFTPLDYYLVITDRQGNILFETRDYNSVWDGSQNGNPSPNNICLWFLKTTAPSGKTISKTGTITIINSR